MRIKKLVLVVAALGVAGMAFAFDKENLSMNITTDAAYYPKSDYVAGKNHFAPLTGPFAAGEIRSTFNAEYKIPLNFGENPLLADSNVSLGGAVEVSPVSVKTKANFKFNPVQFLTFAAGGEFGSGWNVLGFEGLCKYDSLKAEYNELTPFSSWYYNLWASGTFMFDTGAVIPGDWTHVVMVANYRVYNEGLTGQNDEIWEWQCSKNRSNGLQYWFTGLLAYQMPLTVFRVGLITDIYGHFDSDDFGIIGSTYDGEFATIEGGPLVQLKLSNKDMLTVMAEFARRRSFEQEHEKPAQEPLLLKTGDEWYFYRVAFSWVHSL